MPDLALRDLGGAVVWTNDDLFAEVQNLIKTGPAEYRPATFGHKGQVTTAGRRDADAATESTRRSFASARPE